MAYAYMNMSVYNISIYVQYAFEKLIWWQTPSNFDSVTNTCQALVVRVLSR